MNRSFLEYSLAVIAVASVCSPTGAQNRKLPPGALQGNKVQVGYGLEKDQPFAGADPDGTGLPFKEPPPEAVAAARKAPTPRMIDGHPDLTGFWAPAGWGYAVTQGKLSADGKTYYTQRQEESANQTAQKAAELKKRTEGANLPPYKPD
jgi:hypothetical protein